MKNIICTYKITRKVFLILFTDLLSKSISTNLKQRKRGNVGKGEWGREWGITVYENACIMSEIFYR